MEVIAFFSLLIDGEVSSYIPKTFKRYQQDIFSGGYIFKQKDAPFIGDNKFRMVESPNGVRETVASERGCLALESTTIPFTDPFIFT